MYFSHLRTYLYKLNYNSEIVRTFTFGYQLDVYYEAIYNYSLPSYRKNRTNTQK